MPHKPGQAASKKKTPKILASASPVKSVADELNILRKQFRELIKTHANNMEVNFKEIEEAVKAQDAETLSSQRVHELRDMLMEMRKLDVKPEKGRRKDLKKFETVTEELQAFVASWK